MDELIVVDELIKQGSLLEAQRKFKKNNHKNISSKYRAFAARLSWRLRLPSLGLKILGPFVREKLHAKITSEEVAEYSICLNALGSNEEAENRLNEYLKLHPHHSLNPWLNLALAFVQISKWNYDKATIFLKKVIDHSSEYHFPEYNLHVVKINLLAAMIFSHNWRDAKNLFEELDKNLTFDTSKRLKENLEELKLQFLVGSGKFSEAIALLKRFDGRDLQGPEKIYYLKWKFILEISSKSKINMEQYREIRKLAFNASHWEVVRDLDARVAIINKNDIFLKRVLYSSPWASYRRRWLQLYPKAINFESSFTYRFWPKDNDDSQPRSSASQKTVQLDLINGEILKDGQFSHTFLKQGSREQRLLLILSGDLYRSHSAGSLFSLLFPTEYFNPIISPNRVHQITKKTRKLLKHLNLPLEIEYHRVGFRLKALEPIDIRIPWEPTQGKLEDQLIKLKIYFKTQDFIVSDASEILELHPKSIQRLLKKGCNEGLLLKKGNGRATRYHFV